MDTLSNRPILALALVLSLSLPAFAQRAGIDPKADEILKKMGQALASAQTFSFQSNSMSDQILPNGQKVQVARNQKVLVRRPSAVAADVAGDVEDLQFRYDGKHVTLYNPRTKNWGQAEAPASIDETLDMLVSRYGMVMPLADLLFADPYATLIERARSGQYVGEGYALDTKCHHLAFRQDAVDWQIWIEQGDHPVPRKLVITYKDSPAHPQFTVFLNNWDLSAKAPNNAFVLEPPAGSQKVDFAAPSQNPGPTTKPAAPAAPPSAAPARP